MTQEELIEEISRDLQFLYRIAYGDGIDEEYDDGMDRFSIRAGCIIDNVLSAVRDGKQKIPGEVRRMDISDLGFHERYLWFEQAMKSGATAFIALCREEK